MDKMREFEKGRKRFEAAGPGGLSKQLFMKGERRTPGPEVPKDSDVRTDFEMIKKPWLARQGAYGKAEKMIAAKEELLEQDQDQEQDGFLKSL